MHAHSGRTRCFNPRPPPERGATAILHRSGSIELVSIHAPLRREERLACILEGAAQQGVSIHAPLRREERLAAHATLGQGHAFQSTPPSGERSDAHITSMSSWASVFQSTPPSGERSDRHGGRKRHHSCVSIHAPLRREERLPAGLDGEIVRAVSIHAPLRREERRTSSMLSPYSAQFQSTPPSGERSDM